MCLPWPGLEPRSHEGESITLTTILASLLFIMTKRGKHGGVTVKTFIFNIIMVIHIERWIIKQIYMAMPRDYEYYMKRKFCLKKKGNHFLVIGGKLG